MMRSQTAASSSWTRVSAPSISMPALATTTSSAAPGGDRGLEGGRDR